MSCGLRQTIAAQKAADELEATRWQLQSGAAMRRLAARLAEEKNRPAPAAKSRVGFNLEAYGDRFAWVAESEETARAFEIHNAAAANFRARQIAANADFLADAEENTGVEMSIEEYSKQVEKRETLAAMTRKIAALLEAAGVWTKREDGYHLWRYAIHSGALDEIELWRRICFLPSVAARVRARILSAIEFFIQENRYLRFWTFTTGARCFTEEIPARMDWAMARLRKLNHQIRKRWGVSILFRAWEFGTPERAGDAGGEILREMRRDASGVWREEPTFHPHMHLIVSCERGFMAPEKWEACCRFVRRFWNRHCDFTGGKNGAVIGDAREFVKYVTKPGEILKLSPDEVRRLYEATKNRRLIRPMGRLARQIRERRENQKTLRRRRTKDGWRWVEVLDHNKTAYPNYNDAEKITLAELKAQNAATAHEFAQETAAAATVARPAPAIDRATAYGDAIPAVYSHAPGHQTPLVPHTKDAAEKDFCRVVARLAPLATARRLKEPCVIVMGTRFDKRAVRNHELVFQLWARTVEAWEAGELLAASAREPAPIYVHTGTVSVPGGAPPSARTRPLQLVMETA